MSHCCHHKDAVSTKTINYIIILDKSCDFFFSGLWPMKFIYRWNEVYFQDVKLLAYDHLYNSNCTPTHVKKYRLIIIRDER